MKTQKTLWIGFVVAAFMAGASWAQQAPPATPRVAANPAPNCTATPAQLEANRQIMLNPTGDAVSHTDPSYKQHNPAFIKGAREAGLSDYDYFVSRFGGAGRQGGARQGGQGGRGQAAGPQPPAGNPVEIVVAQCDIVVAIHMNYRQDPTAAPGTFYQAFTFDAYRVKDGKYVEHWDAAVINPPAPAAP